MRKPLGLIVALFVLAAPASASAATKTVTLSVPGMTCPACPITVKKALTRLDGVKKVRVDFDQRQVVVTFDEAQMNVGALLQATTNAGYPSTVKAHPGSDISSVSRSSLSKWENTMTGGGQIAILLIKKNVIELTSNRFTCSFCAKRVILQIKTLRGVSGIRLSPSVGVSHNGSATNGLLGTLTVAFDPSKVTANEIAAATKSALEADPYDRSPVTLAYLSSHRPK